MPDEHHTDPESTAQPVLTRKPAPSLGEQRGQAAGDRAIRWATAFSVLFVTAIAAVISYGHAHQLVTQYGETAATARALPLTVDGLVATCSLVILHYTRRHRRAPWHAWDLLVIAVCATVGANVAGGLDHGVVGAIVTGWPALVAVGTFELLIRLLRDGSPGPRIDTSATIAGPVLTPPQQTLDHVPEQPQPSSAPLAADLTPPVPLLEPKPYVLAAIEHYADELAEGRIPSIRRIKRERRVGHPKASRIHAALAQHAAADTTSGSTFT